MASSGCGSALMYSSANGFNLFEQEEKVRIDILKRFGYYSTESNGHLSEYVAWYRKRPDEIKDWINLDNWINGETGGYLRVTREERTGLKQIIQRFVRKNQRNWTDLKEEKNIALISSNHWKQEENTEGISML